MQFVPISNSSIAACGRGHSASLPSYMQIWFAKPEQLMLQNVTFETFDGHVSICSKEFTNLIVFAILVSFTASNFSTTASVACGTSDSPLGDAT